MAFERLGVLDAGRGSTQPTRYMTRNKSKRAKAQVLKQRAALKKLKRAGLYTGKVDGRKKLNKYQQQQIAKYADVIAGRAAVLKPKNARNYKRLYRVKGNKVIVPRRKGERLAVKGGEIVSNRKVGKTKVRGRLKRVGRGQVPARPEKPVMYAIPFRVRGSDELRWLRFPQWEALKDFMLAYERYKDWEDYVLEEHINADENEEADDKLTARLERRRAAITRRVNRESARRKKKK